MELGCLFCQNFYVANEDGLGIPKDEGVAIARARALARHVILIADSKYELAKGDYSYISLFEDLVVSQAAAFLWEVRDTIKSKAKAEKTEGTEETEEIVVLDADNVETALDRHFQFPLFHHEPFAGYDGLGGETEISLDWMAAKTQARISKTPYTYWYDLEFQPNDFQLRSERLRVPDIGKLQVLNSLCSRLTPLKETIPYLTVNDVCGLITADPIQEFVDTVALQFE